MTAPRLIVDATTTVDDVLAWLESRWRTSVHDLETALLVADCDVDEVDALLDEQRARMAEWLLAQRAPIEAMLRDAFPLRARPELTSQSGSRGGSSQQPPAAVCTSPRSFDG